MMALVDLHRMDDNVVEIFGSEAYSGQNHPFLPHIVRDRVPLQCDPFYPIVKGGFLFDFAQTQCHRPAVVDGI